MADTATATVKPHRTKNPGYCHRCSLHSRRVPAEWNVKIEGQKLLHMCDAHARYWAAQHGMENFPHG